MHGAQSKLLIQTTIETLFLAKISRTRIDLQMTNFVSSNNDAAEATSIFDDCNTVDFLKSLIHNASSSNICESFRKSNIEFERKNEFYFSSIVVVISERQYLNGRYDHVNFIHCVNETYVIDQLIYCVAICPT